MTREEAIEQLQICKDLIMQDGQDYLDDRDIPLIDMAIEALSEPNIVRCGECKHWSEEEKQEAMSGRWCSICKYFSENFKYLCHLT